MTSVDDIPASVLRYFDLSSSPYSPELVEDIAYRRETYPDSHLFFDLLLQLADIDGHALYPPKGPADTRRLLQAIYSSPLDRLKRDCFFYYLLKDCTPSAQATTIDNDGGDEQMDSQQAGTKPISVLDDFVKRRCLPKVWKVFMDGYWALDHGEWETAVNALSSPSISSLNFIPQILTVLSTHVPPPLALQLIHCFITATRPPLESEHESSLLVLSLASASSLSDAFGYIRSLSADSSRRALRETVFLWLLGSPPIACGNGKNDIQSGALREMLHLPLLPEETEHLVRFVTRPPRGLQSKALELMGDLVTLRLIHQGQYRECLQLEKDLAGTGGKEEDRQKRREMVREFIGVLPEIQRRVLLDDFALSQGTASKPNGDIDMASTFGSGPARLLNQTANIATVPVVPPTVPSLSHPLSTSSTPRLPSSGPARERRPESPFAGPPRFASPSRVATPMQRRVLSGSPFNPPPKAVEADKTPTRAPRRIINDDPSPPSSVDSGAPAGAIPAEEEEDEDMLPMPEAVFVPAALPTPPREPSVLPTVQEPPSPPAKGDTAPPQAEENAQPEVAEDIGKSRSTRRATRAAPPTSLAVQEPSKTRRTRQQPPPTLSMPGSFNPTPEPSDGPLSPVAPTPARSTRQTSRPPRKAPSPSPAPSAALGRSRTTRSVSRALEGDEHDAQPPSKRQKGKGRARASIGSVSTISELRETSAPPPPASVRRSTRRGTTQPPSERGSPTPSFGVGGSRTPARRTRTATSATPRASTRRKA